ncbi:hypothetical protein GDO86_006547 [Hymenochirus boettgeri]|uniref:Uncharacterized protein n=1 Tax=Hymenochirus boettgeri TaxID=247094 RepID=A0A8T2J6N1_9PIPI|nr:hypothetical protein GDO86_006547 [Hymenochirus boettgeri]KAG8440850.1 hypothetical protein GDO86_006547 [Hymenochirus boettgeri]
MTIKKLCGVKRVRDLCRVLRLPNNFVDTAVCYFKQAFENPVFHLVHLQKKELLVGCCVYVTCRQNQWPLTMGTICSLIYTNQENLSSLYTDFVRVLKLDVPYLCIRELVKTHCKSFKLFQDFFPACPQYAEKLDKVSERTEQIVELASKTWLVTGRHPLPVITAACYLSWQSLQPSWRMSCKFTKFCRLSEVDRPVASMTRLNEIWDVILKLAAELPWLKMLPLNKKTVVLHLGDILKHRMFLLRRALTSTVTYSSSGPETVRSIDQPSCASVFLPPCLLNTKKRRYSVAFPCGSFDITGDEDISDSEIEQYLRTPAEIEEFQKAQSKM